eukprot:21578-Pelagomonas_calceolata.AAC.1
MEIQGKRVFVHGAIHGLCLVIAYAATYGPCLCRWTLSMEPLIVHTAERKILRYGVHCAWIH